MIATGNHFDFDSLRGAPPPGEAMGAVSACATKGKFTWLIDHIHTTESMQSWAAVVVDAAALR